MHAQLLNKVINEFAVTVIISHFEIAKNKRVNKFHQQIAHMSSYCEETTTEDLSAFWFSSPAKRNERCCNSFAE